MKTILAALDFSPVSAAVCGATLKLARLVGARVVLLHCIEPRYVPDDMGLMADYVVMITDAAEKAAALDLDRHAKRFKAASIPVKTLCVRGQTSGAIVEEAARCKAGWVVLGSHGHTAIYDLVVGSTAHRVLVKACTPVIVVPSVHSSRAANKKCV